MEGDLDETLRPTSVRSRRTPSRTNETNGIWLDKFPQMRRIRYGMNTENKVYDYLVIGSGLAGLSAAIELSQYGHVLVATKVCSHRIK